MTNCHVWEKVPRVPTGHMDDNVRAREQKCVPWSTGIGIKKRPGNDMGFVSGFVNIRRNELIIISQHCTVIILVILRAYVQLLKVIQLKVIGESQSSNLSFADVALFVLFPVIASVECFIAKPACVRPLSRMKTLCKETSNKYR